MWNREEDGSLSVQTGLSQIYGASRSVQKCQQCHNENLITKDSAVDRGRALTNTPAFFISEKPP